MRSIHRMVVFAEVVRQGSFTAAADALGNTKSSVSENVTRLEKELGVRLLNRTTRRLTLTEAGRQFAERCEQLRDLVKLATDEVHECEQRPKGPIAVTAPQALESVVVLPVVSQLCQELPDLSPRLVIDDRPLDLVREHVDVAISVGRLEDSDYRARRIGHITEVFCVSPAYLAEHGEPTDPAELVGHRFIATSWQQSRGGVSLFDSSGERRYCELSPEIRVNTVRSAAELAIAGLGVALLPDVFTWPLLQRGQLLQIMTNVVSEQEPVFARHPYDRQVPLKVRRFMELAESQMRRPRIAGTNWC